MTVTTNERPIDGVRVDIDEARALTVRAASLVRDLWRVVPNNGELSLRLVDAGHALYRAIVALSDESKIG